MIHSNAILKFKEGLENLFKYHRVLWGQKNRQKTGKRKNNKPPTTTKYTKGKGCRHKAKV